MESQFDFDRLSNIKEGMELVPDWLSGSSTRDELRNTLITLCHRLEVDGAMILARDSLVGTPDWTVVLSSFSADEFSEICECPDIRRLLGKNLSDSQTGIVQAKLDDRNLMFITAAGPQIADATIAGDAVIVFMCANQLQYSRLAELHLAARIIWNSLRSLDQAEENVPESAVLSIEQRVAHLYRSGASSDKICQELGLSPHTVFHLMRRVAKKFQQNA